MERCTRCRPESHTARKIHFVAGVALLPEPNHAANVELAFPEAGGLHLHPQKTPSRLHHEVIPAAVSPRFDHAQPMLSRPRHKKYFYPLAAQLELPAVAAAFSKH